MRKKTDFDGRKIRDIVFRLRKRGKIKVEGKGVYLKADPQIRKTHALDNEYYVRHSSLKIR